MFSSGTGSKDSLLKDVKGQQIPQEPVGLIQRVPIWHSQQFIKIRLAQKIRPLDRLDHIEEGGRPYKITTKHILKIAESKYREKKDNLVYIT